MGREAARFDIFPALGEGEQPARAREGRAGRRLRKDALGIRQGTQIIVEPRVREREFAGKQLFDRAPDEA